MKIGIEAQRIFRKKKHGMDIVALELIHALQKVDKKNEYFIFAKEDEDTSAIHESSNFKIVLLKGRSYPYWEQIALPQAIRKHGLDLIHCTANTAPIRCSAKLVLTLHDIIYLEKLNLTKGTPYQIFGNLYRRWNVPIIAKQASKIITVSEYEKVRIEKHFNLPSQTVHTIYNGVGNHFVKIDDVVTQTAIRIKYSLPDAYVFFLGNTDPKKNLYGVLKALSILRKKGQLNFKLLVLDIDHNYLMRIADEINDREILSAIYSAGYVPNHELPAIYSMAKLFLYPSLRESFGIPIVEAMACGTPVITSNTSSMPEVAGHAAKLVDPHNPEDIAMNIHELLADPLQQQALSAKGLVRSKEFSWANNARKVVSVYEEALAR